MNAMILKNLSKTKLRSWGRHPVAGHLPNARGPGFKSQPNKGIKGDFKINKTYFKKKKKEKLEMPEQFKSCSLQIAKDQTELNKTYQKDIYKSQINNRKQIGRRLGRKVKVIIN